MTGILVLIVVQVLVDGQVLMNKGHIKFHVESMDLLCGG
tara:strand:- start:767 stop:883 length:117 start_codon:yes stop_codon:yes gene_type:complete